jgi:hypothetical protein
MVNIDKITDKVSSKINKENISRLGDKLNTKLNDNIDKINKFGDKLNNKISDNIDRLSSKQSGQTSQNFDNQAMCLNVDSNETLVANDEIPHEIKPTFSLAEPPKWKMEETCCKCGKRFIKILQPRHHCRSCGNSFCSDCITLKQPLPQFGYFDQVLVCDDCFIIPNTMPVLKMPYSLTSAQYRAVNDLQKLERKGDYITLIYRLRELIEQDIHILSHSWVKKWIGKRWRNFFIMEACREPKAIKVASRKEKVGFAKLNSVIEDERPVPQRIAEYFFKGAGQNEWIYADVPLNGFTGEYDPNIVPPKLRKNIKKLPIPQIPAYYQNTDLVFCPGLFNGLLPVRAFEEVFPVMETEFQGINVYRVDSHPLRGCEDNMKDFDRLFKNGEGRDAIGEMKTDIHLKDNIIAIGYSKGMPDLMTYMANNSEQTKNIKAIFSYAGAVGGSYLADNINNVVDSLVDEGKADKYFDKILTTMCPVIDLDKLSEKFGSNYCRLDEMESSPSGAINSLTTEYRAKFVRDNKAYFESEAWNDIPIFTITGSVTEKDVPYFQESSTRTLEKYDKNNDMQLITEQAQFPCDMNIHLAYVNAHHWDLAFQPFPKKFLSSKLKHPFPKLASANAMWLLCAELGLAK